MYIVYRTTADGSKYASAAVSKRAGAKTSITYTYLGRVLDEKAGIYQNAKRGVFKFDPKTNTFSDTDASYVPPKRPDRRKTEHVSVDFGDAWFLNQFLLKSGFMKVVDSIGYGNPDTLHSMLLFYMLSNLSNCDAIHWYEGNITRLLYPNANMTSQRISDFLKAISTDEKRFMFQKAWISYVFGNYSKDQNILVDSSGLPNGIHMPYTQWSNHGGKVEQEVRLIFVVQRSTGLPLFFKAVPGNIVDISTLERVLLYVKALGIDVESCIIDAGYNSGDNLDLFYDENHQCKINFITRLKSNDKRLTAMIDEELSTLHEKDNFVEYDDRYLFIKKKQINAGSKENNPAWMYLGLDCARLSDEQNKLMKRAVKDKLDKFQVFEAMKTDGLFGLISGREYSCEEILPAYYQRQAAEQIFDFAKNYTKLLPLRTNTPETFRGHLLLAYIAACAVKMLQMRLKTADLYFGSRMEILRNLKCEVFSSCILTDTPQALVRETYEAVGIECPPSLDIENGRLKYKVPSEETQKKTPSGETETSSEQKAGTPKKRGRPKGSKNKKTLENKAMDRSSQPQIQASNTTDQARGSKSVEIQDRESKFYW